MHACERHASTSDYINKTIEVHRDEVLKTHD